MARDLRSSICAQLFPETETGSPLLLDPKLNGFGDGGGQLRAADGRLELLRNGLLHLESFESVRLIEKPCICG